MGFSRVIPSFIHNRANLSVYTIVKLNWIDNPVYVTVSDYLEGLQMTLFSVYMLHNSSKQRRSFVTVWKLQTVRNENKNNISIQAGLGPIKIW